MRLVDCAEGFAWRDQESFHWLAAEALGQQLWDEKKVLSSELESTYGFVKSPQQRASSIT
jgi:hypothetical protein